MSILDVGAFSDEDVGLNISWDEASPEWAELEASMIKKGLLKGHSASGNPSSSSVGTKRKAPIAAGNRSPKRGCSIDNLSGMHAEDGSQVSAPPSARSKRVVKSAEVSASIPRKAQSVPLDADGRPILPVTCGIVTVHDLGTIIADRQAYHNKRYIWPVGFHSSRTYLSSTSPEATVVYHSLIKDGGAAPIFEVWAEDAPEQLFQSPTSTGVWTAVFKAAASIRAKEAGNSASGPDFYGFSNNTIAMMIETLPGVENCLNYQKKNFELTGKPPKAIRTESCSNLTEPDTQQMLTDIPNEEDIEIEEADSAPQITLHDQKEPATDLFDLAARELESMGN